MLNSTFFVSTPQDAEEEGPLDPAAGAPGRRQGGVAAGERGVPGEEAAREHGAAHQAAQEGAGGGGGDGAARHQEGPPHGAAALLRGHPEGDAVQEARGVRLALLQARGRRGPGAARLPRHHQAAHGPGLRQGERRRRYVYIQAVDQTLLSKATHNSTFVARLTHSP